MLFIYLNIFQNYESFELAIEREELFQFLKLAPPKQLSEEKQVRFQFIITIKINIFSATIVHDFIIGDVFFIFNFCYLFLLN